VIVGGREGREAGRDQLTIPDKAVVPVLASIPREYGGRDCEREGGIARRGKPFVLRRQKSPEVETGISEVFWSELVKSLRRSS